MSYDIDMRKLAMTVEYDIPFFQGTPTYCLQLVEVEQSINMTYNVAPIFQRALGGNGLRDLQGIPGFMAEPRLRVAVADMMHPDNYSIYQSMNPVNGWGTWRGAYWVLETLLEWCIKHPDARIDIW